MLGFFDGRDRLSSSDDDMRWIGLTAGGRAGLMMSGAKSGRVPGRMWILLSTEEEDEGPGRDLQQGGAT